MNKKEFKQAMMRGMGRCVVELSVCEDIEEYRDIVLWGCLNNVSYNENYEGEQSEYMYTLQSKFHDNYFEPKIIDKFMENKSGLWEFEYLANLLYYFAVNGSRQAKKAMHNKYKSMYEQLLNKKKIRNEELITRFEWLCIWLVTLEGISGFRKIVKDLGQAYITNPYLSAQHTFEWFYEASIDNCGSNRVVDYIEQESKSNIFVKTFSDNLKGEHLIKHLEEKKNKITVPEVIELCKENDFSSHRCSIVDFSYRASSEELEKVADSYVQEDDDKIKMNMLWAFSKQGFPIDPDIIIQNSKSENEKLSQIAFKILGETKNIKARDYSLILLKDNMHIEEATMILLKNFRINDNHVILNALRKIPVSRKDEKWHEVYERVIELADKDRRVSKDVLLYLYENTLCCSCRESVIKILSRRKMLDPTIIEECRYDCNEEIRKFIKRKIVS